jgi:hypothetical protein
MPDTSFPPPPFRRNRSTDIFQKFTFYFTQMISEPSFVFAIIVIGSIVFFHIADGYESPIDNFVLYLNKSESTKHIGTWLSTNKDRFVGTLIFIPTVFVVNARYRMMVIISAIIFLYFLPIVNWFEYLLLSIMLLFYCKMPDKSIRFAIIITAFISYYIGFITFGKGVKTTTAYAATPTAAPKKL